MKNFLGPKKFLVGYLTIADFKLAHVVDLFGKMASRFCIVNPFGDFHSKEYAHLGLKTRKDSKEHEDLLKLIGRDFFGIEDDYSLKSKRELATPNKEEFYAEDPFENLRLVRRKVKGLTSVQTYLQGNNQAENGWVDEVELETMADLGRYVAKEFVM